MSTKKIAQLPKSKKQVSITLSGNSKSITANFIEQYDETINRIWSMYQEQVNRNSDLMAIINRQQEMFGKSIFQTPAAKVEAPLSLTEPLQSVAALPVSKKEKENEIEALSYIKIRKYSEYFCELFESPFRRKEALHNMLQLLYNLHLLGGKAEKEELFTKSDVADVTGFRIVSILKEIRFIETHGKKFNSYYVLAPEGLDFLNLKLTPETARARMSLKSALYKHIPSVDI